MAEWIKYLLVLLAINIQHSTQELASEDVNLMVKLTEQVMDQEFHVNERQRSEGHSGLKKVRLNREGTKSYHAPTHSGWRFAAMHNHADHINIIGLGEVTVVMNGVEFRTRHNDYTLKKPSETSGELHAVDPIELPEVPPEVLNLQSVEEQITEMREFFRAWAEQDTNIRDYRPYFKPVMCYMEGAWFDPDKIEVEGFYSDRHQLDAVSWEDLLSKIMFTSDTGRKQNHENYAYLPTKIVNIEGNKPVFAQWNYRILCHPLKNDIPLNRFRAIDDLDTRMRLGGLTYEDYTNSSAARFQVNPAAANRFTEHMLSRGELDVLMEQIPGKDNYPALLTDDSFNLEATHLTPNSQGKFPILNTGYYHRWYKVGKPGAMGTMIRHRGFNDENLFMAMTTQEAVVPTSAELCENRTSSYCVVYTQRWSYAIPLEVIYLTPLSNWNPYGITFHGDPFTPEGRSVTADGRDGSTTPELAFNGIHNQKYYMTPAEFFGGEELGDNDPVDTTLGVTGVLDSGGTMRLVRDSGHRIFLPYIPGVGVLRQRYPIMPVHGEGSSAWKEMEALKDIVLEPLRYNLMLRENIQTSGGLQEEANQATKYAFVLRKGSESHAHMVYLSPTQLDDLYKGEKFWVMCETVGDHSHELELQMTINPAQSAKLDVKQMRPWQSHPWVLGIAAFVPEEVAAAGGNGY